MPARKPIRSAKEQSAVSDERKQLSVVFDCMIFLQGLIKETSPAVTCLELFEKGEIKLFVSDEILDEIADVLTRPKLQTKFSLLTEERANKLVETLKEKAEFIANVPQRFSYARDPKDERYINLAVEAQADYIISRDTDLLDLMIGYSEECKEFRRSFRPLKIIDPGEFLKEFAKTERESGEA